tara:strand:+ start:39 stop:476 length:438 start_codon:yes stop_codon:yes gene_type:complete
MLVNIKFEVVKPTNKQIEILYNQLRERKYSISHNILPDFEQHKLFVTNNPYRLWYIVRLDDEACGNVYYNHDNSISLNGLEELDLSIFKRILIIVFEKLQPLSPIPSVRYKNFFFNVAVNNIMLQNKLKELGYIKIQETYISDNK